MSAPLIHVGTTLRPTIASKATDLVESGKTLAYRNDVEAKGSTSYRTLPETTRTWSEDVMQARNPLNGRPASEKYGWSGDEHAFRNKPHPGLVHLAEQGYDPRLDPKQDMQKSHLAGKQLGLPFEGEEPADVYVGGNRGGDDTLWELRQPKTRRRTGHPAARLIPWAVLGIGLCSA